MSLIWISFSTFKIAYRKLGCGNSHTRTTLYTMYGFQKVYMIIQNKLISYVEPIYILDILI